MFDRPRDKAKIFFAALKIFLCITLMTSSTYALFTYKQRVEAGVTAGDMDIDLFIYKDGEYKDITEVRENLFGEEYWEPGQTRTLHFKVVNNSNINVKYSLQFVSDMGDLGGALEYCAFESASATVRASSWQEFCGGNKVMLMKDGMNLLSGADYIPMMPGDEATWTVAVHMVKTSGNDYQGKDEVNEWCDVSVRVHAVQGNADLTPQ